MPDTILSIQVIPKVLDPGDHYPAVEDAIAVVQESGLHYEVGAVGTTFEGELDQVLGMVAEMQRALIARGCVNVISQIRLFHDPAGVSMDGLTGKFRE